MISHSLRTQCLILFGAAILLWACNDGTGSTTESGVISGRLLTAGKAPVAGATVTLIPVDNVPSITLRKSAASGTAVTDGDGRYSIANVAPGIYNVSASKDSLSVFRDSLNVPVAGIDAGSDTLRKTGSISGRIGLEPGDDPRTVLILLIGTNILAVPRDSSGSFAITGMAQGEYRVRFLCTISKYAPLDTLLRIRSGLSDSLPNPIRPVFTGIKAVAGVTAEWDAASQSVSLQWQAGDPAVVAGYNVYRALQGAPMGSTPLNTALINATSYRDIGVQIGAGYIYTVKAVDKNGNVGEKASSPVSITSNAAYALRKKFTPQGFTPDDSPLAVSHGEIFWLERDRVDVYDTAGVLLRGFASTGAGALINAAAIRVFGDTVYVADFGTKEGVISKDTAGALIRKYGKQGAYLDSLRIGGSFRQDGPFAADFNFGPNGTLYLTNGFEIYSRSPDGKMDSAASPLNPELQNLFSKLEPLGDRLLLMGSLRNMTTDVNTTQLAFLRPDLSLDSLGNGDYFMNAYAGDALGRLWIVRDDSVAEGFAAGSLQLAQRISLPKSLYRDIQVEGETVYLYDSESNSILIYDKREN
ncbi:MAG: carboxypeptidase regulatory-like domain-containing protein [Fibrobacteria bacterium]